MFHYLKYIKNASLLIIGIIWFPVVASQNDSVLEIEGWWKVVQLTTEGSSKEATKNLFFRKAGKLYLVNPNTCETLSISSQKYNTQNSPKTGYSTHDRLDFSSHYAYKIKGDKLSIAFFTDARRQSEAPKIFNPDKGIGLVNYIRVFQKKCSIRTNADVERAPYAFDENKSPLWSVNCINQKQGSFFMDESGKRNPPVWFGNSITAIPYPPLHDVEDIYKDYRIKWKTHDEIDVLHKFPNQNREEFITFYRCSKNEKDEPK